jgi:hypothetical protein
MRNVQIGLVEQRLLDDIGMPGEDFSDLARYQFVSLGWFDENRSGRSAAVIDSIARQTPKACNAANNAALVSGATGLPQIRIVALTLA